MTRLVQARLTDSQYDWLAEHAADWYEGDLSKAIRDALETAQIMEQILNSADPEGEFKAMLRRGEESGFSDQEAFEEQTRRLDPDA
jgi:hypothetical protein